jgi:DNA primase
MKTSEGRVDAFKQLLPAVQRIPDKLERAAVASDIAGYLGVEPGLVLDQFKRSAIDRRSDAGERRGPNSHHTQAQQPAEGKSRPEIPPLERILLNALVSNAATRAAVLPRLISEMTAGFASREIFEALRILSESEQDVSFAVLDARLGETSRTLLHEIVAADEIGDDQACLAQAEACLRRLNEDFRRKRITELKARIKNAERSGNFEEALRLMAELHNLEQEASGPATGAA